jgi:transposase-like protein
LTNNLTPVYYSQIIALAVEQEGKILTLNEIRKLGSSAQGNHNKFEREQHLGARPYERSPERKRCANGYKPKTVKTRVSEIQFDVAQVRHGDFYPDALGKFR